MHSATAQSTTTDIIVNIRRFIDCPYSELSFVVLLQKPKILALSMHGRTQRHMTTVAVWNLNSLCDIACAAIAPELSGAWCFPLYLMLGIREEGGRDPNERLDNQNHPEDALEGVAVSLKSAAAHPKTNGF